MSLMPASPEDLTPGHRPYEPFGAALKLMRCRGSEVLISGPAGTGKSRACLEKLHVCAEKYPGMRGLILRKTRESLSEAALFTFENKVVPEGHPILAGPRRNCRQVYRYANGSQIVVGGMDKASKVMSTEYDLAYVQEAIELVEDDWESVTTRLRNGVMPYQQLIADTNPDTPTHWLKRRCDAGKTLMLESRHEDNPTVTAAYLGKLDNLTGPRYHRLRLGKWVQAEGVVYEGWDRSVHLIDRFPIPVHWPRYWSVDFGYTNPFVCQFWAADGDGRLYRYREIYHSKRLVEDHARAILAEFEVECRAGAEYYKARVGEQGALEAARSQLAPHFIVCDHDAEDRATLERHLQMRTTPAKKDRSPGIQAVASRLKVAGDGKPRLLLLRNSVVARDPVLDEARKPLCTEEEIDAYIWDTTSGRQQGEVPVDKDNHGLDALRYVVAKLDSGCFGVIPEQPPPHVPRTLGPRRARQSAAARRGLFGHRGY
jgi:phage terminase large subunit